MAETEVPDWHAFVAIAETDPPAAYHWLQEHHPPSAATIATFPRRFHNRLTQFYAGKVREEMDRERRRILAILDAPCPGFPGLEELRRQYMRDPAGTVEDFMVAALEKLSGYDAARARITNGQGERHDTHD